MYDPDAYQRSIRRGNVRPKYARRRLYPFGFGLAIFWAVYLAAIGYGLVRLYGYVTGKLNVG